jgi:hypothetical protein
MIRCHEPRRTCLECLRWVIGGPRILRCPKCAKRYKNELSKAINQRNRDAINNKISNTNATHNNICSTV